ncbi:MAG: CPBP family intramembrane glutamic endopeptidase [Pseudohongiellaceae bacterium]|jgi:membrane protease YdiL (CAAX protease family)
MQRLSVVLLFLGFATALLGGEALLQPLLARMLDDAFLGEKLGATAVYLAVLGLAAPTLAAAAPQGRPRLAGLALALLFGLPLVLLDLGLTGAEVWLVAQHSPTLAAGLWDFAPAEVDWGPDNRILGLQSSPLRISLFLLVQVVLAPATEEVVFRGLIFPRLHARFGLGLANLLTACLFTVLHPLNQYLATFVFSLLITRWLARRGRLMEVIVLHGTVNLLLWLGSGLGASAYLKARDPATLAAAAPWWPALLTVALLLPALWLLIARLRPPAAAATA